MLFLQGIGNQVCHHIWIQSLKAGVGEDNPQLVLRENSVPYFHNSFYYTSLTLGLKEKSQIYFSRKTALVIRVGQWIGMVCSWIFIIYEV